MKRIFIEDMRRVDELGPHGFVRTMDDAVIASCSKIQDRNTFWLEVSLFGLEEAIVRHRAVANNRHKDLVNVLEAFRKRFEFGE